MIPGFKGKIPPLRNKESFSAVSQEVNSIFQIKVKPENVRTQCTQKQKPHLEEGSSTFPGEGAMHSGKCRKDLSAMQTCKRALVPGEPQFSRRMPYRTPETEPLDPVTPQKTFTSHTTKLHRQLKVSNHYCIIYLWT